MRCTTALVSGDDYLWARIAASLFPFTTASSIEKLLQEMGEDLLLNSEL